MVVHIVRNRLSEGVFAKLKSACTCSFRPFVTKEYGEIKWRTALQIAEHAADVRKALKHKSGSLPVPGVQLLVMEYVGRPEPDVLVECVCIRQAMYDMHTPSGKHCLNYMINLQVHLQDWDVQSLREDYNRHLRSVLHTDPDICVLQNIMKPVEKQSDASPPTIPKLDSKDMRALRHILLQKVLTLNVEKSNGVRQSIKLKFAVEGVLKMVAERQRTIPDLDPVKTAWALLEMRNKDDLAATIFERVETYIEDMPSTTRTFDVAEFFCTADDYAVILSSILEMDEFNHYLHNMDNN